MNRSSKKRINISLSIYMLPSKQSLYERAKTLFFISVEVSYHVSSLCVNTQAWRVSILWGD